MTGCTLAGDERAQWANFHQKNLLPFNVRLQLSGIDEKGADAESLEPGLESQGTDHDIQEMVSQSIAEGQEEVGKSESQTKAAAGNIISSQAAAASKDSKKNDKILDKLKHELDKRFASDDQDKPDSAAKAESKQDNSGNTDKEKEEKQNPEIEYKLRTKGVQVPETTSQRSTQVALR